MNSNKIHPTVKPNPVISRNCPAYSDTGNTAGANDEHYFSFWNAPTGSYIAYDLSCVPEKQRRKVTAVWYNSSDPYDCTVLDNLHSVNLPSDYIIETNAAPGGRYPENGWETAVSVTDNVCHSRQHIIDMNGCSWIRMNITKADGKESGNVSVKLDIHDVSAGVSDNWIFYGDSITACGMHNCYGTGFATYINRLDSRYFPVQENGGTGGITSSHGAQNADRWLTYFPGKYVSIAFGTNDCWGNQTGADLYYRNTRYMIEKIKEHGRIPVLPVIPYALDEDVRKYLGEYNAMVRRLYDEYPEIIKGPDFEQLFREHPELLSPDGVHPSADGYDTMRRTWAEQMYRTVYRP